MPERRLPSLSIILVFASLLSCAQASDAPLLQLEEVNRIAEPDVSPASEDARNALQNLRLPPGLTATLWAAEPMLANPVGINFDGRGRLFVAETYRYRTSVLDIRDYLESVEADLASRTIEDRVAYIHEYFGEAGARELAIESERIRLLEDRDGDGTADHSTIYAEDFDTMLDGIGSDVLPWRDGVFFTNIPSLWFLQGEEKAETRTELSRGYGVRFGYTGHDLHGLTWGPDGKLYFSVGDRGAHVPMPDGSVVSSPDSGAVFRCNPDGSDLEIIHTGLRNPQDLLFTENGDLFTGDNDSDQGDQERLVQIVEGGDSGWRIGYQFAPLGDAGPWNLELMWTPRHDAQPAYMLPPICNTEDGPSGVAYYPGTGLSPEYAGTIFITHFKGSVANSGIQSYKLEPEGATYRAVASEQFLGNALPTDMAFGPDGRLYYSDWAEGWPKSKRGRIYAIEAPPHRNDPARRETQRYLREGMEGRAIDELAHLIGHADQRVRLEAQFALAAHGAGAIDAFKSVATQPDAPPLGRLHAIWGLGQLARNDHAAALEPLRPLLDDIASEVRAQAARVLGDAGDETVSNRLIKLLDDANARVRFFAAQSLGKMGRPEFAAPLLAALRANNDRDPYLRHALVMGLVGANNTEALAEAVTDNSRAVRLGVLLAMRRLGEANVARFLEDRDPFLVAEAARAINGAPIVAAYPSLAALVAAPRDDANLMRRAINAAFRIGTPEQAATLGAFAARADQPDALRAEAITQLTLWPDPPQRDRLVGIYRPLPEASRDPAPALAALRRILPDMLREDLPESLRVTVFEAVRTLDLRALADELFAAVNDSSRAGAVRAAALETLDSFEDPRLTEAVDVASSSGSPELQIAALPIAARLSPESMIPVLAGLAMNGDTEEQRTAFAALAELDDPAAAAVLRTSLRSLGMGDIAPGATLELLEAAAQRDEPEIKQLLARREGRLTATGDPVAPFRFALHGGNARRGWFVFNNNPVFACQRCHLVGGRGGQVGPDLSQAGSRLTREQLLESIIAPNATISEGYDTVAVALHSGEVYVGTVAEETETTLSLRLVDNTLQEIAKADIARRDGAPSSMPAIYTQALSKRELRDLIEYLAGLDVEPMTETRPRALTAAPAVSTLPEVDALEK